MLACVLALAPVGADEADGLPARAAEALRQVTRQLTQRVAVGGGYPATIDASGARRYGDRELGPHEFVVGEPGTAGLGLAWLDAFSATAEPLHRDAALAAARALCATQLQSGGWADTADPTAEETAYFRRLAATGVPQGERRNETDLRPSVTPAALRLLLRVAELTDDVDVRAAAVYGLRALLQAQLAGGGWPAAVPLPDDDRRHATQAEGLTSTIAALLFTAGDDAPHGARDAALAAVEFLLTARGSEPPGWSPAYDADLRPVGPADPEATLAALEGLLAAYRATADERYLAPFPASLDWLRAAAGGALAERIAALREAARWPAGHVREPSREERAKLTVRRAPEVARCIAALDEHGRWLEDGVLDLDRTAKRIHVLAVYLQEYEPLPEPFEDEDRRPPQHRRP